MLYSDGKHFSGLGHVLFPQCISIGTGGGLQLGQQRGQVLVVSSAVRDEGTSYHYLGAGEEAAPDRGFSGNCSTALSAAGIAHVVGST
jgi:uridine phosphorylase